MTLSTQSDEQQRINREASAWVVLNDERELTREEEQAFERWRKADPRHEQGYQAVLNLWDDLPETARHVPEAKAHRLNVIPMVAPNAEPVTTARNRWPTWAIATSAAAAILLALVMGPQLLEGGGEGYETAVAQQRIVTLEDGSVVTLGPRTRIKSKFGGDARRVELAGGEAFFEVTRDPTRPFLVEAGASLIQVVGTKFDVNVSETGVRVAVLEGIVRVRDTKSVGDKGAVLRKGQRTEVLAVEANGPTGAPVPVVTSAGQAPGAWRQGRLAYDDVRLADLVADMNRYYLPGVTLEDPALGELRVTAFFTAREIPAFLDALPGIVPVDTRTSPSGAVRIAGPKS